MMNSLVEVLRQSEWLSALAILVTAFAFSWKIYLQFKTEVASKTLNNEDRILASQSPESLDNLSHLLVENFRILSSFYRESLTQYRASSIASIAVAILGFVVIISGVLLALLGEQVAIGTVTGVAGIVGEAAALLFFKQTATFQRQMESSLQKLVSSQYLMTSVALAREMDGAGKYEEMARINQHLRSLMDTLHEKRYDSPDR